MNMIKKPSHFSPELRQRAVRMVLESKGEYDSMWATVESIAPKIGCSATTLLKWVNQSQVDSGDRPGVSTAEQKRIKVGHYVATERLSV